MIDKRTVVHMLALVRNDHSAQAGLCMLAGQRDARHVSGNSAGQRHGVVQHAARRLLPHIEVTDAHRTRMSLLQLVQVERRTRPGEHLDHLCRQAVHALHGMVARQQTRLGALFQDNQDTAVHHKLHVCTKHVDNLYRAVRNDALRDIQEDPILNESRVEGRHPVARRIGQPPVILPHKLGTPLRNIPQTPEDHAFRQTGLRRTPLLAESVVHHEIQRSTHVRHIAPERLVRVHRHVQPVEVQAVIRLKELPHIGVSVSLRPACRETLPPEVRKSRRPRSVQHTGAMPAYHMPGPRKQIAVLLFSIHSFIVVIWKRMTCLSIVQTRDYTDSPNSSLIQSYPRSSSSRASPGPAVFTIRPL